MSAINYRVTGVFALGLAGTIALAGCTVNPGTPGTGPGPGMNGGSESGNEMMEGSNSRAFSATDIMFAQMMTPHHQQAIDMSNLALRKSTNPDVLALARQIRDAQAPEITVMNDWLADAGANSAMGNNADDMGMGAGGILSADEMTALKNATEAAFDTLYLQGMIGHHEGAIQMAQSILNSRNAAVKRLGQAIVKSQTAQIAHMKQLLGQ